MPSSVSASPRPSGATVDGFADAPAPASRSAGGTRDAERELRRRRTRDLFDAMERDGGDLSSRQQLLQEIVMVNMGVARALAGRHRGRGIAVEDLNQVAYTALVRAADHFRPAKSSEFLTYAVPCVRGELRRHFRDQGWMVRPPRSVQEVQSKVVRARDELFGEHGGTVPMARIAEKVGIDRDLVERALQAEGCFQPVSLDAPMPADETAHHRESAVSDLAEQEAVEARAILGPALRHLTPKQRRILLLRFFHERSQQEIAVEMDITQTQVSRQLARVLHQLREAIENPGRPADHDRDLTRPRASSVRVGLGVFRRDRVGSSCALVRTRALAGSPRADNPLWRPKERSPAVRSDRTKPPH